MVSDVESPLALVMALHLRMASESEVLGILTSAARSEMPP